MPTDTEKAIQQSIIELLKELQQTQQEMRAEVAEMNVIADRIIESTEQFLSEKKPCVD